MGSGSSGAGGGSGDCNASLTRRRGGTGRGGTETQRRGDAATERQGNLEVKPAPGRLCLNRVQQSFKTTNEDLRGVLVQYGERNRADRSRTSD